jgi:PIN domain nuclease of toxin-antitoxin system
VQLLLDTHALLWWLLGEDALPFAARAAIADGANASFVSAASAWEISTKHKLGRLPEAGHLLPDFDGVVVQHGFIELPVTIRQAERAGSLPLFHRDPFDRMLIAQALAGSLTIVSNEQLFDRYGVARLW